MLWHVSELHSFSEPNDTPLYGFTTFCLLTHLLMDSWLVYTFWLLGIKLLWTMVYENPSPWYTGTNICGSLYIFHKRSFVHSIHWSNFILDSLLASLADLAWAQVAKLFLPGNSSPPILSTLLAHRTSCSQSPLTSSRLAHTVNSAQATSILCIGLDETGCFSGMIKNKLGSRIT